jgi:acyl-CoA thioester hydrolase
VIHRLALRPRFAELDPYGHVNHAVYVSWFEEARCDALAAVGAGLDRLHAEGFQVVVADLSLRYRRPVTWGEPVTITTQVVEEGRASSRWRQQARTDDGVVAVEAELRAGVTGLDGRPRRAPAWLLAAVHRLRDDGASRREETGEPVGLRTRATATQEDHPSCSGS